MATNRPVRAMLKGHSMSDCLKNKIIDRTMMAETGEPCLTPSALDQLLQSEHPGVGMISPTDWVDVAQHLRLSAREFSVAVLIFEGNSRFQIAKRLKCSPETSRGFIDRVFAKLKVRDRLGMVLRVVRVHLAVVALQSQRDNPHKHVGCKPNIGMLD
jgi:DNA-binding CsgD family transcriptional regulator